MTGKLLRLLVAVVVVLTSWAAGNVYGQSQTPADTVTRAEFDAFRKEMQLSMARMRDDFFRLLPAQATKPRDPLLLK